LKLKSWRPCCKGLCCSDRRPCIPFERGKKKTGELEPTFKLPEPKGLAMVIRKGTERPHEAHVGRTRLKTVLAGCTYACAHGPDMLDVQSAGPVPMQVQRKLLVGTEITRVPTAGRTYDVTFLAVAALCAWRSWF
jgi:hypothetical protein